MFRQPKIITAHLLWCAVFCWMGAMQTIQGQWSEPQRLLTFSAVGAQDVWITNDGLRLYCQAGFSDLYISTRSHIDSTWSEFDLLPSQINEPGDQVSPCESPNGDTLYFCNWSRAVGSSFDVYYSVMTDTGWGPKQDLGAPINTPFFELGMRLSRDGTMMVVSRGGDLFYHERQQDGTWGPSVDFGQNVNTWRDELQACLSPDKHSLFFYREGPNNGDVLQSDEIDGVWQEAAPLPAPICSVMTREDSPCMLVDGHTLVFRHEIGPNTHDTQLFYSVDTTRLTAIESPPNRGSSSGESLRVRWIPSEGIELYLSERSGAYPVRVYNIMGQTLYEGSVTFAGAQQPLQGHINLGQLTTGNYFVTVRMRDSQYASKFIITK
jgi:hypothetical protein